MSLDIRFITRREVRCPHCGEVVHSVDDAVEDSGGRAWYPILDDLGYYVPWENRTAENDWYGKDMVLTDDQAQMLFAFVKKNRDLYNRDTVLGLIATAIVDDCALVINADW